MVIVIIIINFFGGGEVYMLFCFFQLFSVYIEIKH